MYRNNFCSNNLCNDVLFSNNFQTTPPPNNPDPNIIIDPPILHNPPACAVFNDNNSAFNVINVRQPLNDLEPDPPIIKLEPLSPDFSSLQISDPSPSSTSLNLPFIADCHPDKYPYFIFPLYLMTPCLPHLLLKFNHYFIFK